MQGTVFLPDSHVIGRPPISVLFPPLFPFGLPHWPYPAGGPLVSALPPTSPPAMPNSAQILEAIHEDAKKPLDLRTLAAAVDVEIESAIVEAGLNRDNATHRRQIIESLAIRKLDALETHEANVNKLVGHHPLWKSTAATIIAYEQRYGSIDDDPELFIQRITYSYAAARSRDYAAVEIYYFSTLLAGSTTEEIRARVNARALVEAERIAAKAAAKAEAERIAAEAAAKAEAERIAAETELIRLANTYSASGSVAVTGSVIITAVGTVVSTSAEYLLRGVIGAAVGAVSGFTASVGAGFVVGVSALFYSPNLGNGELPRRYSLQTPLSDLDPQLSVQLAASAAASASYIDLPYRFSSQLNANDDSEIFAVKTGGEVVPSQVRILTASYDTQRNVYTATTADVPPRTLTWTPIVTPGDSSTGLPADQRDTPIYKGATLKPIEIRIDSYPGVADASWDDYVIIFPADSGLPPIYTMFRDRREEMGTASGLGVEVDDHWATSVETRKGAPIPRQISDLLRGQQFRNWRAYREALWKAVSSDAFLAAQFDPVSIGRMRKGFAPFARLHERVGALASLQIHHKTPISEGGDVYNSENIVIVTPKQHINIHHGEIE